MARRHRIRSYVGRSYVGLQRRIRGTLLTGWCAGCALLGCGIDGGALRRRLFASLNRQGLSRHRRRSLNLCASAGRRDTPLPRSALGVRLGIGSPRSSRTRLSRLVDDVVDDGRVVDIGKDDVVRRRRDIDRRLDIDRDRHKERLRQDEQPDCRYRRRQHDEIRRRRRAKVKRRRRWRRKVEFRIAEHQRGPIDVDEFIGRRRRHVVVDDRE
jgi:hypothetical protein